ncbi:MAG: SURF1 family protein [Rhizobacter sp.]|nr:SURF1 family protein [Rhizobacter sp.]
MALTARLGVWQLDRAAQKEALQSAIDTRGRLPPLGMDALPSTSEQAESQHYRPVRLQGEWKPGATVYLDNRQMNGQPGFFVLTPLMLGGQGAVVVQRGWVPRDPLDRTHLPPLPTPAGHVEVVGRLAPPPGRLFDFAAGVPASGVIRQNLALADFSREIGVPLRPWTVLQADNPSTAGDGLLRQWPRPAADVDKHYGYAFQWFGLCALMAGLYVWFQLLRPRFQRRP